MRLSTATVSLSGDLVGKMHACARAGFDGIELFEPDLVVAPESPEEIRALADRLGLRLELYQPLRDIEGVPPAVFDDNLRRAAAKFTLMRRLGIDTVLLCSNVATAVDPGAMPGQLRTLARLGADHGVRIAYEALAWGRYVDDYRQAWRLVQEVDEPSLGLCLDSFHILSRGHDPAAIGDIPGEKIFFVQLADAPVLSLDVLSWSRHHRLFPGEGGFDLPGFLAHVLRAGYTGPLSLEVFNDVFRQTDPGRTAAHALRSLIDLLETAGASARPPAPAPGAFTFAEIRARTPETVEPLLAHLGFHYRGAHRSRPARLWTSGSARVVVNEAPSPRPHLAALGFDLTDAPAALARARTLHIPSDFRRVHEGEDALHAVTAPDGTQIFLCPVSTVPPWIAEFDHGAPRPESSAVTAIDHVNLVQPWEDIAEATLFHRSLLGLEVDGSAQVAGPSGLISSQVMTDPEHRVRLVLNVAPAAARPGALAQHVAFRTDDVVAVAERLRAHGVEALPVPGNYYEDLAARFALDPARLDRFRALGLMYDRDGQGEFIHFYTATVGSVFFEVLQRIGGYDGYGAANAPVRLAAQSREARRG
ncbi:bifunctional sugar phosphate isomerase/epimerase/4-hydroxyphenylpyruvate dioxygenase family protein [Kineosporia succinea]|uniref:3-dehydroshikimate dehydratase n=1 Tax=Kineosporia succinea TaxID=84632 RepID=A0ABT9PAL9_9ACTN|nr:sugar phosphate isomerase/epimerase and 4-hydroxyphenylpyruvate domain-containing protein [Kineosporia succinea]MDP9829713.1 4-hydroxyphenylpyruvate dioxygenase [Kineosporia succinea]